MRERIRAVLVFLGLLALDHLTKYWAILTLKGGEPISILPGVLELQYVENRGAAFGIMQNKQWFFLVITIAVLAVLFWLFPRIPRERKFGWFRLCLFFIAAGAVGNMIDRMVRSYVVDFIYFKLIDFPVFNVADIYVTVSAFLLIVLVVFVYDDEDMDRIFPKRSGRG